ncbi:MAG: CsbD family protein, partial [Hyphomicrobiales bacterium]|nr:CsbD family protein [Hyphomicrobiales bacterium]
MNKDNIEGGLRKTAGQVEEFAGRATKNKQVTGEGIYDQAVGSAQSAYGQAKDTLASGASAVQKAAGNAMNEIASGDLDSLRADVTKLAQTVSQLVQNQANSTRNQITNA